MDRRNSKQGIALMLVLMVASLMMIMLGAFFQVNRAQMSLMNRSGNGEVARRACVSAMEYCFYRLENNKNWAKAAFPENRVDATLAPEVQVTEIEGSHRIEGTLSELGADFQVIISNNLTGNTASGGVPAYGCNLRISATVGSVTQSREAVLTVAPLFDGSAVSSGGIDIEANHLTIASVDPLRNQIRSKGNIYVPAANDLSFNPATTSADKGIVWSQADVQLNHQSVTSNSVMNNAVQQTGGRFIADSKTSYDIHDLKAEEVETSPNTHALSGGIYLFNERDIVYDVGGVPTTETVTVLERRINALDDQGFQGGQTVEFWYVGGAAGTPPTGATLAGTGVVGNAQATPNFWMVDGIVQISMDDYEMRIDEDARIEVQGDFGLASYQNAIIPKLRFGELVGGISNGVANSGSSSIAASGDIGIEGPIVGAGKLLAEGNVDLRPNWASVQSDQNADLAVFAGKDIRMSPPLNWEAQQVATSGLHFRGLLYAKENLTIKTRPGQDLHIRGAAVAREGQIKIRDAGDVVFTYDQSYVDHIVKKLPDQRVQLQRALWKG